MAVLSRRVAREPGRRANREAIIAATLELLGEGAPFAEISIEQIVRRAGLSRPTFYSYFRDKRELILELGSRLQDDVGVASEPWLARGEGEIRATLEAVLDAFRRHRSTLAALVEAATYDAEVNAFWHAFHERFLTAAAARIQAAEPKLAPARAHARAFALVWMTERTFSEHLGGADVDADALLEELTAFWQLDAPRGGVSG